MFVIGPAPPSGITVVAGNNQSAAVTTNYVTPLKVSVKDALGNPVPGAAVTFTAPSSGASVTFLGPVTVTTDGTGVAGVFVTANTQVGSFAGDGDLSFGCHCPCSVHPDERGGFSQPSDFRAAAFRCSGRSRDRAAGDGATHRQYRKQRGAGRRRGNAGHWNPAAGRVATITGTTTAVTNASGLASFADLE